VPDGEVQTGRIRTRLTAADDFLNHAVSDLRHSSRRFKFKKGCQSFVCMHNETLSIVAMCVNNPDRSPVGIDSCNTAPTPSGFAEIVCDNFPVLRTRRIVPRSRSPRRTQNDSKNVNDRVNPTKFLTELKRRNVYRAAVAYGVVAWFLTQLTTQVLPLFEIPNSAMRFVVIALVVGFPIAMLLAWLYEFTPEGIVRTEDLDPIHARSVQRASGRILDFIIIGVLLLVIAMMIVGQRPFYRQTGEAISQKSIAVLPFENRSEDKANAYFADGIQDEILTLLSKIADLKVISRTSTQQYQSKPRNLAEIAKQLGVANILEGSVQKVADQVRVNVQLVNAQTDSHLWADTYDRKLTDIFGVESEIAKRIADSLQAKLTGREEQALAVKPTNNAEAYDAYLRGLAFDARASVSGFPDFAVLMPKAVDSFERAVQLDQNFALAWARLSRANANIYFTGADTRGTPAARRDAAKRALENTQNLEPNSPETLLALGYYQYWVLRDYGAAESTFERVTKMLPSSSEVRYALALVTRREGHWDKSIAYFEQALALDPHNVELLTYAAATYAMVRQFPAALKLYDRGLDIIPNDPDLIALKADVYHAQGNLQEAARLLSGVNEQTANASLFAAKIDELQYQRNYDEAVRLKQARLAQFHYNSDFEKASLQLSLAFAQRLAGDTAGAKVTAESARSTLEQLYRDRSDDAFFMKALSDAYALTGQKDPALKAAERAIMVVGQDALSRPLFEQNLAAIQTLFGENSRAIPTLTRLLQTPAGGGSGGPAPITAALLRLDPIWDPLRADPAFQKLCEEK
jgi:TolB-like protein/Flp pilus assembly protein TadD